MNEELLKDVARETLTGLPYFDSFCILVSQVLQENKGKYHLVAFDIANFKLINNYYGFQEGDRLLNRVIKKCCIDNPTCIVATRIYSDHIVGLYHTDESEMLVSEKVTNYNMDLVEESKGKYPLVPVHMHSGVYRITDNNEHVSSCVDKANMARKAAKGHYNIECIEYNESLLKKHERTAEILTALEEGIENKNIIVLLQPKINVDTHTLVGAEALSRILDKNGNVIRPDEFIPVLERTGKIVDLDKYVTNTVMDLVEKWYEQGIKDICVSVNMSRMQIYVDGFIEKIIDDFKTRKIPPNLIEFEVTESVFLSDTDLIIEKIKTLKDYGFKISIDDFGSGYSSLNLISILPIDVVKLDRGFLNTSLDTKRGREIMKGIINMLKNIDLGIICEGIENAEEEEIVYEFGCSEVQGYLYDKPMHIKEFEAKYLHL